MKVALFSLAAAVALSGSSAIAQDLSVSLLGGGTSYPRISYDGGHPDVKEGFNTGLRIATDLDTWMPWSGFSLAADVFYSQSNLKGQTGAQFDSLSYMGNLIYHLDTSLPFGVYGGAGLGGVRTDVGDPLGDRNSTVFGWQALGGLDYQFSPATMLFVEYRYQNAHDANLRFIGGPVGNTSNSVSAGLKFDLEGLGWE